MAARDEIIRLLLKAEGGPDVERLEKQIAGLGDAGQAAAGELTFLSIPVASVNVLITDAGS